LVHLCVPTTCAAKGIECGGTDDGCYGGLNCGTCPAGLACWQGTCLAMCM
jgi:hypothetical protein